MQPSNPLPIKHQGNFSKENLAWKVVCFTSMRCWACGVSSARKSTLLNVLSNATPKIDSYPFTTLVPTVGVIDYPDDFRTVTMADVPGLVEGAAENRGLGHRF